MGKERFSRPDNDNRREGGSFWGHNRAAFLSACPVLAGQSFSPFSFLVSFPCALDPLLFAYLVDFLRDVKLSSSRPMVVEIKN